MWNLWNLRTFGKLSFLRSVAKGCFAFFFDGKFITIRNGPIKGYRWKCTRKQQFWMPMGVYEAETASKIVEELNRGNVFFDVGANFGYFTMLGAKLVGEHGRVYSFEPIPENVDFIQQMTNLNGLSQVVVKQLALTEKPGWFEFVVESTNANSHLAAVDLPHAISRPETSLSVQGTTLDEFCREHNCVPDLIKLDVEGAEVSVLSGATHVLSFKQTKWIISTHSADLESQCRDIMERAGCKVINLKGFHHELVCIPDSENLAGRN